MANIPKHITSVRPIKPWPDFPFLRTALAAGRSRSMASCTVLPHGVALTGAYRRYVNQKDVLKTGGDYVRRKRMAGQHLDASVMLPSREPNTRSALS